MFSGIVQAQGTVQSIHQTQEKFQLKIKAPNFLDNTVKIGDSIAIDGICLTVVDKNETSFAVDVMPESLKRTNLNFVEVGQSVNLEKALCLQDRIDGHIVQGHVDFCTKLVGRLTDKDALKLQFALPDSYRKFIVEKGSIAVDGVSLTVVTTTDDTFEVDLIPYTQTNTILGDLKINDVVNIETDILGKYLVRQIDLRGEI